MSATVQSSFIIGALVSAGTAHAALSQNVQAGSEAGCAWNLRLPHKYMKFKGKGFIS
jgi:hypothetical protein